jgi:hypothetical protein
MRPKKHGFGDYLGSALGRSRKSGPTISRHTQAQIPDARYLAKYELPRLRQGKSLILHPQPRRFTFKSAQVVEIYAGTISLDMWRLEIRVI